MRIPEPNPKTKTKKGRSVSLAFEERWKGIPLRGGEERGELEREREGERERDPN